MNSSPPAGIDLNADIKYRVIGPVITLVILASVSVMLRVVSQWSMKKALYIDDYILCLALVRISIDVDVDISGH
jgi:hypothetical protein